MNGTLTRSPREVREAFLVDVRAALAAGLALWPGTMTPEIERDEDAWVYWFGGAQGRRFGVRMAARERATGGPSADLRLIHARGRGWFGFAPQAVWLLDEAGVVYASRPAAQQRVLNDLLGRLRALLSGDACDCLGCSPARGGRLDGDQLAGRARRPAAERRYWRWTDQFGRLHRAAIDELEPDDRAAPARA